GALGMTGGIGTVSEIVDGVYTGRLAGPFCYAEGKVEAIEELVRWEGFDLRLCYAYSDSASDLPMLEAVGHPVAVNPDSKLERIANRRGWPVVIFSRRTKSVVRRSSQAVAAASLAAGSFAAGIEYARRRI
ncbi:MAG: haloacid dehalogenase-like hydrolase, partial [Actinobacteria bacterium]|nr:haloacid dehalogenase-like hydrolase [Actinomycetota bacterium]